MTVTVNVVINVVPRMVIRWNDCFKLLRGFCFQRTDRRMDGHWWLLSRFRDWKQLWKNKYPHRPMRAPCCPSVTTCTSWRRSVCRSTPPPAIPASRGRCCRWCGWGRSWSSPSLSSLGINISTVTRLKTWFIPMKLPQWRKWSSREIGWETPGGKVNALNKK